MAASESGIEGDLDLALKEISSRLNIKFSQYPSLGQKFIDKCKAEEYEELDAVIDDVKEGHSESIILEEVFGDLTDIKDDNEKEAICTAIHYTLSTFSPPPTSLNLVDIHAKTDKKRAKQMVEIINEQCEILKPSTDKDEALVQLLVLGKQCNFPLLIYLIDTFYRYQLLEYQKLYKQLDEQQGRKRKIKFIAKKFKIFDISEFFKHCYSLKYIAKQKKTHSHYEKALLWYDSGMKSFFRRLFAPLKVSPRQILYKFNDSLLVYAQYHIALLVTVNNLLKNSNTKLPLQIDFWVIPKAVCLAKEYMNEDGGGSSADDESGSDVEDDDEDSDGDDDDEKHIEINNLDKRLKHSENNQKPAKILSDGKTVQRQIQLVAESVINGQRSKRMVMLIDRRKNGKNIEENKENYSGTNTMEGDSLYAFLPKKSCDIPHGQYLHESMFNLSKKEVIPSENGKVNPPSDDSNAIHVVSDIKNLSVLSVHIHEENVIRAYWFINGSCTRFYVNDMVNIWPLFFIPKHYDEKSEIVTKQDTEQILKEIEANKDNIPLKDTNFDTFFQLNTRIKPNEAYL